MSPFIKSLTSEVRELSGRGGWKSLRGARGDEGHQEKKTLWINEARHLWIYRDWNSNHMTYIGLHQVLCIYNIVFILVFLWDFWMCEQVSLCLLCLFCILFLHKFCAIKIAFALSYLIVYYPSESCLFPNEREKRGAFRCEGKWRGTGRCKGTGNYNQGVLSEKRIYFQ